MAGEPVADLDAFVGGLVIHHQVQLPVGVGAGNVFEESQKFLVTVPSRQGFQPERRVRGADRGGQRGEPLCAVPVSRRSWCAVGGSLFGVSIHRTRRRVDVDENPLIRPRQQIDPLALRDQMLQQC
jgi:hypothetical protein